MLGAARAGTPMVFVDRWIPGVDVPVVRSDGRAAVRALVAHLHALGHRRLAIIAGPAATTTGRERVDAFREALAAHGLALPTPTSARATSRPAAGAGSPRASSTWPNPPEVVFAADNLMALGALDAIRSRGLRVPDDIGLAAFDDIPWFVHTDPPVTAVAQPTRELGRAAVRALVDRIEGRPGASVTLPARLVVRRSCGEGGPGTGNPPPRTKEYAVSSRSPDELLRIEGIRKTFPGVVALDGVDFDLRRGEVHVLLGENGAGKSTLIKMLSGAYTPDAGRITVGGEEVRINGAQDSERLGIATIYQEFNLVPDLTVAENIFLGRQPRRLGMIDRKRMDADAEVLLKRVGVDVSPGAGA